MALFGGSRDISLFRTINNELLKDIIQTEVAYYKFALEQTTEIGDILLFRNNFYEIDTRIENQLILGRDPDYAISAETTDFGESFSVLVKTHISRVEKLNLIPLREGKYPTTQKLDGGTANLLG